MLSSAAKQGGFSIVELVVVVSIIAILATIAALSTDFIRKEQVSSKNKELLADLQRARVEAMSEGPTTAVPHMRGVGIRLVSSGSYVIFKFNDCNENYEYNADGCTGPQREEEGAQTFAVPSSLEILRLSGGLVEPVNSLDDILIFDRLGMLRSTAWSAATAAVLVVRHKTTAHAKCISIQASTIREGVWNGSTCEEQ